MIKVTVDNINVGDVIGKKATRVARECIKEYTWDLHRVATLRTPKDEGNLETSGVKSVTNSNTKIVGQVSFKAFNRGFNYAKYMHDGKYKLGKNSISKSSGGVRSKYSNESFKVGSGYLEGTAKACEDGYKKDLKTRLKNSMGR